MGRKIKKGTKGSASKYITRNMAIKRLQLSLAEFRRLCILKGVYPRDPKKKRLGKDKVYYHVKDILHLSYEPLLAKFRHFKSYIKKYNKAIAKHEFSTAKKLIEDKPSYSLHHIVKERYGSLHDALSNLDDALCTIALFTSLPVDISKSISSTTVSECTTLLNDFYHYVSLKSCLTKVFVSIKGYYFQADIMGVKVLWLVPHQFPQDLPADVDFRVLLTFLEFYRTLLKFVNYKLYCMEGYVFPPLKIKGLHHLKNSFLEYLNPLLEFTERKKDADYSTLTGQQSKKVSEVVSTNDEVFKQIQAEEQSAQLPKSLFSGLIFFVSREVPLSPVALVILSCGGKLSWEMEGALLNENDERITHQIVDRPLESFKKPLNPSREYVQPQWVFDSINVCLRLPVEEYAIGKKLPPHLSPFVDDASEGYIPRQREKLHSLITKKDETEAAALLDTDVAFEEKELKTELLEALYNQEYEEEINEAHASANAMPMEETYMNNKAKPSKAKLKEEMASNLLSKTNKEKDAEKELRKSMLSKKHKRLFERIEYSKAKKSDVVQKLLKKRNAIEKQSVSKRKT